MNEVAQGAQGSVGDFYICYREGTSDTTLCTLCTPTKRSFPATCWESKRSPNPLNRETMTYRPRPIPEFPWGDPFQVALIAEQCPRCGATPFTPCTMRGSSRRRLTHLARADKAMKRMNRQAAQ